MSISQRIPKNIKRLSKCVGYAAWLDTSDAWLGLSVVLVARLLPHQRAGLSYAALKSLSPEYAERIASAVIGATGGPLPSFLGGLDDARYWASCATTSELKAYALAAHDAMSAKDQAAFFQHIREVEIAA